ncbi:3-oxo-5-alpha-steroid 4-dehydrogenase family protein [Trifolium repens]|nr:3-oxo-5-alpha-steroid 4-dehydrogenase family protein [Trifolium repens]
MAVDSAIPISELFSVICNYNLCSTPHIGSSRTTNQSVISRNRLVSCRYHRQLLPYLLSKLRGKGEKGYKIPKGGLFDYVICPHYLFEIIAFYGFSFISQTLYGFSFALGTTFYLLGRSYAARRWYVSKFEDFPKNVKAIIPFFF